MTLDSCVKFEAINTRFKGSGTDNDTDVNETDMKCDRDLKENVNRVQNNNTRKRERMSHGVSIFSNWTLVFYRLSISIFNFYFQLFRHASHVSPSELLFRWPEKIYISRK